MGMVHSLFLMQTWIVHPSLMANTYINPPGWTVSTLAFFYFIFPAAMTRIKSMTCKSVLQLLTAMYFGQLVFGCVASILGETVLSSLNTRFQFYWIVTASPFTRWPVFIMGLCAGVLCNRVRDGQVEILRGESYRGSQLRRTNCISLAPQLC